ncbi:MAG TPA: diguanylate cyclase [Candidatus Baltobacteraceae bacterium]|jgi:diguanylate cyclase (GGDEF)-like protein/PAS domain S-box-containing protein
MQTHPFQHLLASLYDGNPDAIAMYDRNGLLVAGNPALCELTGYALGEIAGTAYREQIDRRDAPMIDAAFAAGIAGYTRGIETTVRRKDGFIVPIECHIFPARDNGEIVGVFVQARDILALRSAELSLGANQERFRSLFEYHPDGIMEIRAEGTISRVNVALESVTGFLGEHLIGRPWADLLAPECRERADEAFALAGGGEASEFEAMLLDRTGDRIDVQCKLVPLRVAEKIEGAYAIAKNVRARRQAERAIATQSQRIRELYLLAASREESLEVQIENALALGCRLFEFDFGYLTTFDGDSIAIAGAFGRGSAVVRDARYPLTESFSRYLTGARETLFIPDLDAPPWNEDDARESAPWRAYFGAKLVVNGRDFGALVFTSRMPRTGGIADFDRDLIQLMALFVAAAIERARHAERIEQLAFYDALTGLPNRVLFDDRMSQTLAAAKRYDRSFAVMYLDLDEFKAVNDTYGHPVGDLVLKGVADRLLYSLRESDTIARFGGDEFVVLQPVINGAADSADLARKLITAMQTPIAVNGVDHAIHTSIGIARYPHDGTTAAELMAGADAALYRAKHAGRNRWVFKTPEPETSTEPSTRS